MNLVDFLSLYLAERSAQNGEILCVNRHTTTVDLSESGNYSIAGITLIGHPKIAQIMSGQRPQFLEGAFIEQDGQPLSRCHLALGMLRFNTLLPAPLESLIAHVPQNRKMIIC